MPSIIIPTDFSNTTITALKVASQLAKETGFDLEVLHIHDGYGNSDDFVVKKGNLAAQSEVQRQLDEFIRFNVTPGSEESSAVTEVAERLKIKTYIGDPGSELVKLSKRDDCALIVMGASGAGVKNNRSIFYGSVAQKVSLLGECPVMLIPADYDSTGFEHIAYSFRGEKDLGVVYNKSYPFFSDLNVKTTGVHLEHDNPDREHEQIDFVKEKGLATFSGGNMKVKVLEPGELYPRLNEFINHEQVDLLIMGRRKRGPIESIFIDTEVSPFLKNARIPLLIIPVDK